MKIISSQSGFTLVEVLAALGVFSIAAIGLSQSAGETTRGAYHMEARILAGIVAENQIVETVTNPELLRSGTATGTSTQLGRTFNWIQIVGPTDRADVISVQVTVEDPETKQVLARLETLKRIQR